MKNKELAILYNVENLFDTENDPLTFDDDFTPEGKLHWTPKKYENKIVKISSVLNEIQIKNQSEALFIGLTEIENEKVLNDLLKHLPNFNPIHFNSPDERGIDVALLYNRNKFFVTGVEPIHVSLENEDHSPDYTRDILYVNGLYQNKVIHIFVVHLPSKRYQDINKDKRIYISSIVYKRMEEIAQQDSHPAILLMGDFNDNPDSDTLVSQLHFASDPALLGDKHLYNPFVDLFLQKHYSLYHKNEGMLFDQIMLSPYFLNESSVLHFKEAAIFNDTMVEEWDEKYAKQPFRTYIGTKYLGGYSDHFPVFITFNF